MGKLSLLVAAGAFALQATACNLIYSASHTFYGWPDNDPASAQTAYDCGRNYTAGGSGTFDDPLTFASAPGEFDPCEVIYSPYVMKYLRMEDTCAQCTTDWNGGNGGFPHIDVWVGNSYGGGGDDQVSCEVELTPQAQSQGLVRYPWDGHTVNSGELYDLDSVTCYPGNLNTGYSIDDYANC
ncbi:hypothetical protein NA57DRAFT_53126 [Rhizodiscina lignyota]|uniref:Uncharacterized protein n=1 Tax=Rhizodiscina lignyota TaxID=1504668 RepID=A0A9P4IL97_9PEZI|nr:hypothetical protein NA57DRAFT_53126 [Rhizodiscina lignyota]